MIRDFGFRPFCHVIELSIVQQFEIQEIERWHASFYQNLRIFDLLLFPCLSLYLSSFYQTKDTARLHLFKRKL